MGIFGKVKGLFNDKDKPKEFAIDKVDNSDSKSKNLLSDKQKLGEGLKKTKKSNLIDSGGLFITETYTKLVEIDIFKEKKDVFNSNVLDYHKSKASWYFNPNILYKSLITHCQNINKILENKNHDLHNDDNVRTFLSGMMEDLSLGMKSLGMFLVDEIDCTIKNI